MDVFSLDRHLVEDYQRFARSFTTIRAEDIREQVDQIYATGKFWPEPIVSINPHFQLGDSLSKLVSEGTLNERTERVFRIDGQPLTLFRHQSQAIAKAKQRQSFVVTTGTGSGKSLCFFIPIIDSAIRARAAGETPPHTLPGSDRRSLRLDSAVPSRVPAPRCQRHRSNAPPCSHIVFQYSDHRACRYDQHQESP